jgi:hypothetical protein
MRSAARSVRGGVMTALHAGVWLLLDYLGLAAFVAIAALYGLR